MAGGFRFTNLAVVVFICVTLVCTQGKPLDSEWESFPVPESKVIKILPRVQYDCNEGDTAYMKLCKIDGSHCCETRLCIFKPDSIFFPHGSGSCSCVCNIPNWDEHDIRSFRSLAE